MRIGMTAATLWMALLHPAHAMVQIKVDLSQQIMHVDDGTHRFDWKVSTARRGYVTPRGVFRPTRLQIMHYSRKYHMSPMPHSIFFKGGYAIHGTYETDHLGHPASHGCVRLSPSHAAILYKMVKEAGARIEIYGPPPTRASSRRTRKKRIVRAATYLSRRPSPRSYHTLSYPWRLNGWFW